jgi:RimJ/RimL family protein N-acetyltransferase
VIVHLRVGSAADHPSLLRIIDDPEVVFWLFAGGPPQGMFYLEPAVACGAGPVYLAETATQRRVIGGGRLEQDGFSYFVCRHEWGKGYGMQIARQMLSQFSFHRPGRIASLSIRRGNEASIRIVEQLGFRFAGLNGNNPVTLRFVISGIH